MVADPDDDLQRDLTLKLEWNQEWLSHNAHMDKQHQYLVQSANRLLRDFFEGSSKEHLLLGVNRIIRALKKHFLDEENLQLRLGFPDYQNHAAKHRQLMAKVMHLKEQYTKDAVRPSAFFTFVMDTVILEHMVNDDTQYFPYIETNAESLWEK